jgi:hypothetical protein
LHQTAGEARRRSSPSESRTGAIRASDALRSAGGPARRLESGGDPGGHDPSEHAAARPVCRCRLERCAGYGQLYLFGRRPVCSCRLGSGERRGCELACASVCKCRLGSDQGSGRARGRARERAGPRSAGARSRAARSPGHTIQADHQGCRPSPAARRDHGGRRTTTGPGVVLIRSLRVASVRIVAVGARRFESRPAPAQIGLNGPVRST